MKTRKFVSEYIKSKDIKAPVTVTMISVEQRSFDDPEKKAKRDVLVVFFKELDQGVVLSKASLKQIIDITGSDETDDWIGKKIVLFNDETVQYMGKRIGGLRFKAVA